MKYQRELIKCVEAICEKYDTCIEQETGKYLFTIIVTLVSLRDVENTNINISLLEALLQTLNLSSQYELWNKYVRYLLENINRDPMSWTVVTPYRCIFETILLESGTEFTLKGNLLLIDVVLR